MNDILSQKFAATPIIYITRDLERALGLPLETPGYFIISNSSPYAKQMALNKKNVLLIKGDKMLDTHELLEHPKTKTFINEVITPLSFRRGPGVRSILVFKPTKQIEAICAANNWQLLNPSAVLSEKIEEKITQLEFLKNIRPLFPPYQVALCKDIVWEDKTFVLQFNHSHTGSGTVLIDSKPVLLAIQQKFPNRDARVTPFISGPIFTNNNVVTKKSTLIGNISLQITGLLPFTNNPFATIGNDWAAPGALLTKEQKCAYTDLAHSVGQNLKNQGWRGLFGIDVILDQSTGKLYLLEINARQPASAAFESQLQQSQKSKIKSQKSDMTIFEAHLAALLELDMTNATLIPITNGAQVIYRNIAGEDRAEQISYMQLALRAVGFQTVPYTNTKPDSDLLRIQSTIGMMADDKNFNVVGQRIIDSIL